MSNIFLQSDRVRHRLKQRPGFGLLEVLFSTAIFIVVVGSLVSLSRLSLRNAALSAHRTQAYNLAQDGLEAVRQMRDSAWIRGVTDTSDDTNNWLTYSDCDSSRRSYQTVGVELEFDQEYEICYDEELHQFGIRDVSGGSIGTEELNSSITLKDKSGEINPGSPVVYKRTVVFEQVPANTEEDCRGLQEQGMQILGIDPDTDQVCVLQGAEAVHFVKVISKVQWSDFGKDDWSVSLNTILTNWRAK